MALSNTTQNELRSQYYDDWYNPSSDNPTQVQGEVNDFHRILFRPKFPVQSRELTQLQTELQSQLERLGKSAFRDGEPVFGGQLTLDTTLASGQVTLASNLVALFDRTRSLGKLIFDTGTTTTRAHVLQFMSADEGQVTNNYLLFKYQTGATFASGGVVQAADDAAVTVTFASGAASDVFKPASIISIDSGVFFVSGFFIRVVPQTIVLNPFSDAPSYRIGLTIQEQFIDELDDIVGTTLLDPANQNAPGAHRFRIKLLLDKRSLDTSADADFIELARVINGQLQAIPASPRFVRFDELNQILARRTYDEAGNYVVKTFAPVIQKDPASEDHFVLSIGPGKAYVRGFEVQTAETTKLSIRKGRTTANAVNRSIPLTVGNFVYAIRVQASSPTTYFANTAVVDIHAVNVGLINTSSASVYNQSKIGTARVRMLEPHEIPPSIANYANNTISKLFFYDVQFSDLTGNCLAGFANGTAITIQVAAANGIPIGNSTGSTNGAIEGATIILSGTNSPVSGTFTVNNYQVTANSDIWITLVEFLPTLPNANTQYKLLFKTKDIDSFAIRDTAVSAIDAPYSANLAFQADVDINSKENGNPSGVTIVSDTNDNMLLYQIPESFITPGSMDINTAIWTAWVSTSANAQGLGGGANLDFTLTVAGANFSLPTGALSATTAQENFLVFDQSNLANGHGVLTEFADSGNSTNRFLSNVVVTQVGTNYNIVFTYHNGAVSSGTHSLIGLAKTTVDGLSVRTKTLHIGNNTSALSNTASALSNGQIEFYSLNVTPGFAYSLKTTDVLRIQKVLYKSANSTWTDGDMSTATDVTAFFTLDTGQRDNSYEYSSAIVQLGASQVVQSTGRLLVVFDWFDQHGRGFASVDSYLSDSNITKGMSYDNIPDYTSPKSNRSINLRALLDFRPVRSHASFATALLVYAASNSSNDSNYLTSTGDSYLFPVSDDIWFGDYSYYLARIDKVALSQDNTFRDIEGIDAVSPVAPQDSENSLLLFELTIPPYTLVDANSVPTGVLLQTFNYRRYTMQDVGALDNRITHLEYYVSLNNLEQVTQGTSLTDTLGAERFKNGIIVDPFINAAIGDISKLDFTASIDTQNRLLRTAFNTVVMQFAGDTSNSTSFNVQLVGDMAILNYTVTPFITQPLATHAVSVNPFDIATFYGSVKLSPAVDIWKDTGSLPAQTISVGGPEIAAGVSSFTQWGEWDTTFSGTVAAPITVTTAPNDPNWINHPWVHPEASSLLQTTFQDVTSASASRRQGTKFDFTVTTAQESIGNIVRDISVIHNIRQRDVIFAADGIRPGSILYPFFDGVDITKRVQQADVLQLAEQTIPATAPFFIGQLVYVKKALTGNAATVTGNTSIAGTGTFWLFEVVPGQLVRIVQGTDTFDAFVANNGSDTAITLAVAADLTLSAAKVYTLTPVTVTDVNTRVTGTTVVYTLKVARLTITADMDSATPYPITAGSLRPEKQVNDSGTSTVGAVVIVPATPRAPFAATYTVTGAVCRSGIVRAYSTSSAKLRFDTDILDTSVATPGTQIFFVSGPGAGQSANVVSYTAANQTAVLDTTGLTITSGQTIYSVGRPVSDGFLVSNSVTSGRAGTVSGVFHIPGGTFAVGTRQFRLTDNPTNNVAASTTSAEANYEASGLSVTQQEVSISSRSLGLVRTGPTSESRSTSETTRIQLGSQWIDPLAETILVDGIIYPQGVFVSSIDLCFASKPSDDIPVIMEIRAVVNGYPSSFEVLPCVAASGYATTTLRNDQVNISTTPSFDDAQKYTRFTFDAPIHLMGGKEYAIIVRSDSDLYTVFTAELGGLMIGSDAKVSKQPYAGSFFKSQNASTWTESPFEDLMFRMNKCVWNASTETPYTGMLVARASAPDSNTFFDSIEFYPHDVQFSDQTISAYALDIKPENLTTGDLTGQIAQRYNMLPNIWFPLTQRSMVQGYGGPIAANNIGGRFFPAGPFIGAANTVDGLFSLSTKSPDVSPYVDMKKVNLLGVQHLINNMNLHSDNVTLENRGSGYLATLRSGTVTTTTTLANVVGSGTSFTTLLLPGDTVSIGGNVDVIVGSIQNNIHFLATVVVGANRTANNWFDYGNTGAVNQVTITVAGGNGTGADSYATINRAGKVDSIVFVDGGSGYSTQPLLTLPAPSACSGFTAPAQATGALSYDSEVSPSGGNGQTRYLTHLITLADGFEARDIVVFFDAYRPYGSHFYVYYKVQAGDADTTRFDDQPWRPMSQVTSDAVISNKTSDLREFEFHTPNSRALDASTDTTDKFKNWAIKVVFASSLTTDVPMVANFRAIALDE